MQSSKKSLEHVYENAAGNRMSVRANISINWSRESGIEMATGLPAPPQIMQISQHGAGRECVRLLEKFPRRTTNESYAKRHLKASSPCNGPFGSFWPSMSAPTWRWKMHVGAGKVLCSSLSAVNFSFRLRPELRWFWQIFLRRNICLASSLGMGVIKEPRPA